MFNHLESLGTQESPVKVDLLHLDPTDPDADAAAGKHGEHCCGGTATRRSKRNAKAGVIPCNIGYLWSADPFVGTSLGSACVFFPEERFGGSGCSGGRDRLRLRRHGRPRRSGAC